MKIKITKLKCKRCGHQWVPKKEDVRQCPKCKSVWWDKEKEKNKKNSKKISKIKLKERKSKNE